MWDIHSIQLPKGNCIWLCDNSITLCFRIINYNPLGKYNIWLFFLPILPMNNGWFLTFFKSYKYKQTHKTKTKREYATETVCDPQNIEYLLPSFLWKIFLNSYLRLPRQTMTLLNFTNNIVMCLIPCNS